MSHTSEDVVLVRPSDSERNKELRVFETTSPEGYVALQERTAQGTPTHMVAVPTEQISALIGRLEALQEGDANE